MPDKTLTLQPCNGVWFASYDGPERERIVELFGTHTLPTPFSASMPIEEVKRHLVPLNPGYRVAPATLNPCMFTHFIDNAGGISLWRPPFEHIYIEAPADEARVIFRNRFKHDPDRGSDTFDGPAYLFSEEDSLDGAAYYPPETVLVIRSEEIKPHERQGDVPEQGYVWRD